MRHNKSLYGFVVLAVLLAACGTPAPTPDPNEILPTQRPQDTPMPTAEAPIFQAPDTRITAENAAQIAYLGRLGTNASLPSTVFAHAISLDGTRLAALNNDLLILWDLVDGSTIFTEGRDDATKVYYSADKTEIYSINTSGTVIVNDPSQGGDLNSFSANIDYNSRAAFFADQGWLALGGNDGKVQVWNTYERTSIVTFDAHDVPVLAIAFNMDGTQLAIAGADGLVVVWDWQTKQVLFSFQTNLTGINSLAFSADGNQLAIADPATLQTYSLSENKFVYMLSTGISDTGDVLRYSSDGRYLLTGGSEEDEMVVLNVADGTIVAQLPQTNGRRTSGHFSPDGSLLVTTVLDGHITLWNLDAATGDTIPSARLLVGSTRVTGAEWSEDGFTLVFFDASGVAFVWGVREGG